MDPLTHTLTGLALSRAGLNRWTPMAAPMLMLAANAPDIDGITAAGGPLAYLHYHRHLTHSLAAMPIMALLPVVLIWAIRRKPIPWLEAWLASLIAIGSHLLLDWTNAYGIRLFLPFSGEWLRLDTTAVIDLWIWVALLLAVAGPFLGRLVGSEISSGAAREKHHGRGFAIFALLFLLVYNSGRGVLHARAEGMLFSRLYRGAAGIRVAALPDSVNPWRWRGLVETADSYAVADLRLSGEYNPAAAEYFRKPEPGPELEPAGRTHTFRVFLNFSQFPLWQTSPASEPAGATLVQVFDLRFGTPRAPGFVASAVVDAQMHVLRSWFEFGRLRPR